MNPEILKQVVGGMDEQDIREAMEDVDFEMVFEEAAPHLAQAIEPHLADIQQRAQTYDDPQEVREHYAMLPEAEQQEVFDETVADLVAVIRDCRERPDVGLQKLKNRIRNPDVIEPLLLIFDNPEHIDPEYAADMKDFAALMVRWAGAQIIPEAYTQQEIAELQNRLSEN